MKFSTVLPYAGMVFLIYLAFVKNIPGHSGIEDPTLEDIITDTSVAGQFAGFVELNEFLEFMKKENNTIRSLSHEEFLDTTGDGEKELVRSSFNVENKICHIKHVIIKDGRKLWDEGFQIRDKDLEIYLGNFELNDFQIDKALGFLGLIHMPFMEKMDLQVAPGHRKKKMLEYHFRNSNLTFSQKINSEFYKNLTNYTGYFVFKRSATNAGIFMWDKGNSRFIEVYSASAIV